VVRRLTGRGLVRRMPDPLDRRAAVLIPTDAGTALATEAVQHGQRITEATLAPLAPPERDHLLALLRRLG
jgi:DNA-binding MarR family transcriptional regulator